MLPLFAALLAALPAAPAREARTEYSLTVEAGRLSVVGAAGRFAVDDARVAAGLTVYLDRVRDDPTPTALQPFLQRASSVAVRASGGSAAGGQSWAAAATAEVYVAPWLALFGGAGVATTDGNLLQAPWSVGAALRLGDLRVAVGWEARYWKLPFLDRLQNHVTTEIRVVAVNHIDLALGVLAGPDRVEAHFDAAYYPTKRLGLAAGGFGGGGDEFPHYLPWSARLASAGDPRVLDGRAPAELPGAAWLGVRIGFSYWATARVGVEARYQAAWLSGSEGGANDQRAVVALVGRN